MCPFFFFSVYASASARVKEMETPFGEVIKVYLSYTKPLLAWPGFATLLKLFGTQGLRGQANRCPALFSCPGEHKHPGQPLLHRGGRQFSDDDLLQRWPPSAQIPVE